jgi:hypothetical protein
MSIAKICNAGVVNFDIKMRAHGLLEVPLYEDIIY